VRYVFADTGCWIALLNPKDALHSRAQEVSRTFAPAKIVTSEGVLTELLNCFAERGTQFRAVAAKTVAALQNDASGIVAPQSSASFAAALQLYRDRPGKNWSITDCSSFLIMRQYGIEAALTFDRHFEQADFRALLRH
jgi:predicted nucleic acid-binding protein